MNFKYLFVLYLIFMASCNLKEDTFEKYNSGQRIYEKKCVGCHNTMNMTTFHPTLIEMRLIDSIQIEKKILNFVTDSIHKPFVKKFSNKDFSRLIYFIKSYEIVVPER